MCSGSDHQERFLHFFASKLRLSPLNPSLAGTFRAYGLLITWRCETPSHSFYSALHETFSGKHLFFSFCCQLVLFLAPKEALSEAVSLTWASKTGFTPSGACDWVHTCGLDTECSHRVDLSWRWWRLVSARIFQEEWASRNPTVPCLNWIDAMMWWYAFVPQSAVTVAQPQRAPGWKESPVLNHANPLRAQRSIFTVCVAGAVSAFGEKKKTCTKARNCVAVRSYLQTSFFFFLWIIWSCLHRLIFSGDLDCEMWCWSKSLKQNSLQVWWHLMFPAP